jgi:hypothetical protein
MRRGYVRRFAKITLIGFYEVEFIPRAHLHTEVAVCACGEVMNRWIFLVVET